ncbi:MAG TPA: phosphoserine phosphatase SerB [Cellvibrionaceae bacterium]
MRELLLITVSGQDRPAVTSAVTGILAQHPCRILDIGQAVIHDHLSLGILAEFAQHSAASEAVKNVLYAMHERNLQVRFTPITEAAYRDWVAQQGKERHIVTLLGRQISAEDIAALTAILANHGLNIDAMTRLSGRTPLDVDPQSNQGQACIEFSARGSPQNSAQLRADFTALSARLNVDIAFQADNMYRRTRRLVCFDMDSTLIEAEVIDELAKAAGVGEQVAAITEAAMRGELDFKQSFARRMALLKGLDESVLADVAASLRFTEGCERLMATLKKLGYKTAILSGGFNYFGCFIQARLGVDYVFANELEIVDGKVTGRVVGDVVDGPRKAQLLRELALKENITLEQVIAVGDGANDLPMLSVAGLGIAFRAKPLVKASAKQAISNLGLDAILYLMGLRDRDIIQE